MNVRPSWFEVFPNDLCIDRIEVHLFEDGRISSCTFDGGCQVNLKVLSENLKGMPLFIAPRIISEELCGMTNQPCVHSLKKHLVGWFQVFDKKLGEGIV